MLEISSRYHGALRDRRFILDVKTLPCSGTPSPIILNRLGMQLPVARTSFSTAFLSNYIELLLPTTNSMPKNPAMEIA